MDDHPSIRVLLIDDEEMLLEYMSKRLLKKGFTVKCTFSGEEAVEAAKAIKPDLVIPMHYGSIEGVAEDATEFVEHCQDEGINVKVLEKE